MACAVCGMSLAQSASFDSDTMPAIQHSEDAYNLQPTNSMFDVEKVPELLCGIWESSSRLVKFDSGFHDKVTGFVIPQVVLKPFYGCYADRAAESREYTASVQKDRNDATSSSPQEMQVKFVPLLEENTGEDVGSAMTSGAWDIQVKYSGIKEISHIPVCVIDDKLYLNFMIKKQDVGSVPADMIYDGAVFANENKVNGVWLNMGTSSGFWISQPYNAKDMNSYYVTSDCVYTIRYWCTDMDYDENTYAVFTDENESYQVPKHIRVANTTYTCVSGRGKNIRKVEKGNRLPYETSYNNVSLRKTDKNATGKVVSYSVMTSNICAFGEPYLTLNKSGLSLEELVNLTNSQRAPDPTPLFPPHGILDFDWSIMKDPPENFDRRNLDLHK